jgi:hypothetical protein
MYDYAAQGPDEMSVTTGQVIELSAGPSGGQNYASGWWEGETPQIASLHIIAETENRRYIVREESNLPEQLCKQLSCSRGHILMIAQVELV